MKLRRTSYFALAAMLAITLTGLTAHAQQLHSTHESSQPALNLSDAQVFQIQALLFGQTKEIRSLYATVQSAQETLSAAVAKGDPVLTASAVLSLDAAEKALKNTQLANQRNLLSLLNESQKQLVKDYSSKSVPASD